MPKGREVAEHHTRVGDHSYHQGEMWRSTVFVETENSDQSISDDDNDLDGELPEDHVSLGIPAEEKGKVQILSQLDMLRDANEVMHERHQMSLLQKRQVDSCVEDDVEFPFFANSSKFTYTQQKASACNSDEEILSDNEIQTTQLNVADDACASFHHVFSRSKRSCKGGERETKTKTKSKFSVRTQLHNQDEDDCSEESIVKYNNKTKSTSEQLEDKTRVSLFGDKYIEDDSDHLGTDSSEEDKEKHQIQGPKQKTISDQFYKALGAASTNEKRHVYAGFGLFRKLQHVMQREKERDLCFLSKLQKEEDEASCIEVKILSKHLEGKLTVCSCSSIENEQTWLEKNLTVIFSSRICSDVALDVGILLRIHPPWKEVNVKGKEENTILSTYFSQI